MLALAVGACAAVSGVASGIVNATTQYATSYSDPVPIEMIGVNNTDFRRANAKVGLSGNNPPEGYTWHHMEDGKHMILIRRDVHDCTIGGFPHAGGASVVKNK